MKKQWLIFIMFLGLLLVNLPSCGDDKAKDEPATVTPTTPNEENKTVGPPEGKEVYIPQELRTMNLKDKNSQWYWGRTKSTDDVILFWAKGFGDDLSKAPDLQGQNMKVDADNLLSKVQEFYDYYYNELKFVKPGSTKADKYRMMVMLDYSLEGTAYGGTYDNEIGALWVAPNRVQDKNMNAVAHELGHSFQLQVIADGAGDAWGGCGFYEMTSQWMLWQVNPEWTKDEYYHFEDFRKLTHKAYLHLDNIYHSPYVIEFWGERHGLPFIADLYRNGKIGEDPVQTYKRLAQLDQEQFNDEMWENYARLVNFDIDRVRSYTRNLTSGWSTALVDLGDGWKRVAKSNAPENYGFNVIEVGTPEVGSTVTVDFRGEAGADGYVTRNKDCAGWRYGFVAVDKDDKVNYGDMQRDAEGSVSYTVPEGPGLKKLWFVVMGAPTRHWSNTDSGNPADDAQWPYSIKITQS
ncbi:MAG: hypothetical protein K2H60_09415 [Muribaculaceae bacterium]|nr:hypothetical protein [Muribaculaceae bacterium]